MIVNIIISIQKHVCVLLQEYGALFYETSALSGENVPECMDALAR